MTIQAYAGSYLPLKWTYKGETYEARINKYLSLKDCSRIDNARKAKAILEKAIAESKTAKRSGNSITAENPDGAPKVISGDALEKTFKGTASPSQIRDTLWLATHLTLITNDPAVEKTSKSIEFPQHYADYYLGTECKGFAMNYLGKPGESVESLDVGRTSTRRQRFEDVQANDVMIVSNPVNRYHHVGIVTKVSKGASKMQIETIESFGWPYGGLPLAGICSPWPRDLTVKAPGIFKGNNNVDEFYFQPGLPNPPSVM